MRTSVEIDLIRPPTDLASRVEFHDILDLARAACDRFFSKRHASSSVRTQLVQNAVESAVGPQPVCEVNDACD